MFGSSNTDALLVTVFDELGNLASVFDDLRMRVNNQLCYTLHLKVQLRELLKLYTSPS